MDIIDRIREKMNRENLMFVYRGIVTNENSVPLLMLLEKEMENAEFALVGRKRLFMFVLESLQNISKHSDHLDMADMSMVVYSKAHGGYTVTTGNVISAKNIENLKKRLDEINNLNTDETRAVYRQMLSNSVLSSKGGAGLGLIMMAIRTGNKLDYDFLKLDDEKSYYILSKTVNSEGIGRHFSDTENLFNSQAVSQLERMMAENCIYLIWSGHITADVSNEVLSFTETKLSEDNIETNLRRRVFSILVEIIENVARYSPGREDEEKYGMPVATIRFKDKTYYLTTGNIIRNDNVDYLREKLDIINEFDEADLKKFFRKSLLGQTADSESTGNMGLIDMAMKSGNKLLYQFREINDTYSYFTLTVRVEGKSV